MAKQRELERRYLARPMEWRAADDSGEGLGVLHGYAAVFNTYSQNLGGFVEQIDPRAFNKTLADGGRVLCRYNHDDNQLLGTTDAETLRLEVDNTGLAYDVDLPDTTAGRDCSVLARRLDLRFSSFAFYCIEDEWSLTPDGFMLRTVLQAALVDVAPVNSPAYLDSTAAMRSLSAKIGPSLAELREGKQLSAANLSLLQGVRRALDDAGDSLTQGQEDLVGLLDSVSPADPEDDGERSLEPGRTEETEPRDTHSIATRRIDLLQLQLADLK